MTEEIKREIKRLLAAAAIYLSVCAYFTYVGASLGTSAGYTVTFDKLEYGSVREAFLGLSQFCVFDVLALALVGVSANSRLNGIVVAGVLALRSAAFGCALSFILANYVTLAAIVPIISFGAVSLVIMLYSMILKNVENNPISRGILYLIVTGGAALLRLLPLALL